MKTFVDEKKKKRIFDIIQIGKRDDFISRAFDIFIVAVILVNIAILFMETFEQLDPYASVLKGIETVTVIIFCLEYILRIWTAEYLYPDQKGVKAVLRFLFSFDGIVDLLTILPFFFLSGFVAFRMLRVVRIFHLFRINAYYDSFNVITSVLYEKRNQIISSIFIILVLMMASSLCMYSAEHDAQPEVFNNAFSGIWWSISTILTVGYGDIYPITALGRLMAILIAFLGVGAVAIPTGIISAGFVEQYTRIQNQNKVNSDMKGTSKMLYLRPYKEEDAKTIISWCEDENVFRKWTSDRYDSWPITEKDMNHKYFDCNGDCAEADNFYPMTACDEEGITGHFILRYTDGNHAVLRIGFVIVDNTKRGRGYGKEMIRLAIDYAFRIAGAEQVTIGVFENNQSAYHCYKAAGFHDITAEEEEICELFGEKWRILELAIDRNDYLSE